VQSSALHGFTGLGKILNQNQEGPSRAWVKNSVPKQELGNELKTTILGKF
jgi:hypothetical protein